MTTKFSSQDRDSLGRQITRGLYESGMIKTWYRDKPGGWRLASGLWSPYYINLRLVSSFPELYVNTGKAMEIMMDDIGFKRGTSDKVVGIAMAGIALANAITFTAGIPSLYTRKLPEDVRTPEDVRKYLSSHGQKALVEGEFNSGDKLALIDDLVTGLDSKLLAHSQVIEEAKIRKLVDVTVDHIVVLLDREQGGAEKARSAGFQLCSFIPFATKGVHWLKEGISEIEYKTIIEYMVDPQKFQIADKQAELQAFARR